MRRNGKEKPTGVCASTMQDIHNGILFSPEEKQSYEICNEMYETGKH